MAGSIIKRDKNKYLVRLYVGIENGKRKYHSKLIQGNKKNAQEYLNKILRDKDLGLLNEPSNELIADYLNYWLEHEAQLRVREKTYINYRDLIRLYIHPYLGPVKLSKVSSSQIQTLYKSLISKGLSPKTIKNVHGVLFNALKQAVIWGKINRNPAENVTVPRQVKKEMKVFNPSEAKMFVDVIVASRLKAFFSLLITTGMRPGEALALKWKDINFHDSKITINRALTRIEGRWNLNEPKTASSRRTIPIPPTVMKDLEEHKDNQDLEKAKVEEGKYFDHGFVFANKNGEPLDERNIVNRHFKPILKDAGLPPIRLYDLRHTCATLLLSAGENPKIVSERLGHASINLTMDTYSHVLPDMQKKAAEKMEDMLFGKY